MGFYHRTHTTSQHITGGFPTTNGANEGDSATTDEYIYSNHRSTSVETVQAGNIDSSLVDPDPNPDELIFEGLFISLVVDDGAWIASVPTGLDEFSPGVMFLVTKDIVSPVTFIPIDNQDFQYESDEINFAEIPVDPTITIPETTDPFVSNTIKYSTSTYADSLDICPSSSDFENYFDCVNALSYLSPDFNREGETQTHSVGKFISEVHENILANTSIESFSGPIE